MRRMVLLLCVVAGLAWGCLAQSRPAGRELGVEERIGGRGFPSVFQAWNPADNLKGEDSLTTLARHDLVFHDPRFFHLKWNDKQVGLATGFLPESVAAGREMRATLLAKNPHLVLLAEIRYRDAPRDFLPEGHEWWQYDQAHKPVPGWKEGGFVMLDFAAAGYQKQVARQARAAVESGVFDGVMLDWWRDDEARLGLLKTIRAEMGDKVLILVNANDLTTPQSAPLVNGYYMECWRSEKAEDWQRIGATLQWAQEHLRQPRINCVETWFHKSRDDLNLMRATTTLALTMSDGYCLFGDPDPLPTPDHLHNWYPFWEKRLGKAAGPGEKQADGTWRREFDHGTAVYNPMGNAAVKVQFAEARTSAATGKTGREHRIEGTDGDLFLR